MALATNAAVPPQAVIDFDRDPSGNPIADDQMVNNLYVPWGVALSSFGTASDGNVYARNYTASATPDTPPNVQSLFKAPLATDFNDNLGRIRATFQPPARQVIVAVIPMNQIGHPYLRAYNAAGGLIAEDSRSSTPGAAHLWLRVSAQTDSIAWVEYSSYGPQGAPTHVIFDTLIARRTPQAMLPDPIWVDDDNVSGMEDGSNQHPFNTIAEAMALAITHTIQVRPGTYRESVLMRDGVKLIGSGPLGTILDGNSPGVSCTGVGPDTVVAGFTITGASQGIVCQSASPTLRDNIIFEISPGNLGGDGIRLTDSSPNIHNNVIYHVGGMGIRAQGNSEPRIVNNTIYDYGYYAGISFAALNIGSVTPVIFNNIVMRGNSEPVGGILWKLPASPILGYNDVFDPANVTGGGSYYAYHDGTTWQEASGGPGAISENPQFVDESHGDFHLRPSSPCVNAGHPDPEYLDTDGSRNDIGAYGGHPSDPGGSGFLGSGFIFTSVGKIPITEIVQDPLSLTFGLAVVSPTAAMDFQIPQYLDSPFGGSLWIRGLFGVADSVDYYQLFALPEGATTPIALDDPLSKVRYTILPGGTVVHTTVHLGPQTIGGVPNLYQLNKEGYWSHEDLRMVWNTSGLSGRFTLTCQPYIQTGTDTVAQVLLPSVSGDHLTLWLDSSPLEVRINEILFADHTPIAECEEIALPHGASNELIFNITAFHPGGFLNSYSLDCAWGHNHYGGNFTSDHYAGVHNFPPPIWVGVLNLELPALLPRDGMGNPVPWEDCAYGFTLSAGSRVTDGFQYLQATSFTSMHAVENLLNKDGGETPMGPCANCPPPVDPAGGNILSAPETILAAAAPVAQKGASVKAPPGDTVWV
ncbi:MAG: right-handed parallel beta-helix repeat-containing protein, partial [Candidatus Omnitrophica bacterium]|nr:right-handed parallel beta-helix repeat-containing protein [Candidatus Omnitrophota bacterium]